MSDLSPVLAGINATSLELTKVGKEELRQKAAIQQDAELRETAEKFEASFIAQMLKHGGLAKALTTTGGKDTEAFTTFYIEQLANKVVDNGGFGLADNIYEQLRKYNSEK